MSGRSWGGRGHRGGGGGGGYRGGRGGNSNWGSKSHAASTALGKKLLSVDGRSYKEYIQIKDSWELGEGTVVVDHVQGDPYAKPSKVRFILPQTAGKFPKFTFETFDQRIATADYLTRIFASKMRRKAENIRIIRPSQVVLERNSIVFDEKQIEVRFLVHLPGPGRKIDAAAAVNIFERDLLNIVKQTLYFEAINSEECIKFIECYLDQIELRKFIANDDLVAFVPNGAILPRESGISDFPLKNNPVSFKTPESLKRKYTLKYKGEIEGMGIPKGITLFVGGGFHGKSTLLKALQNSIYNHIPGDGREYVVTDSSAVTIEAEDGRFIHSVNISPFIDNLPSSASSEDFTTMNASGSTSQAASIIEAIECQTKVLLIDEDKTATNFMCRDKAMQMLVSPDKEPITPFISKVNSIYNQFGISTLLVVGGLGEYFTVADHILMMDCFQIKDVTAEAKEISKQISHHVPLLDFGASSFRKILPSTWTSIRNCKVQARDSHTISVGHEATINLECLLQIAEIGQTELIISILKHIANSVRHEISIKNLIVKCEEILENSPTFDILSAGEKNGRLSRIRPFELIATLNRFQLCEAKINN